MTNFDDIWTMLNNYHFEIDPSLSIFTTCTICQKLLNDAYQGPCGCNYCLKCIENYINKSGKYCPGKSYDCKLQPLSLQHNIIKDAGANIKVSKLEVKCPSALCKYITSIFKMGNHLKVCDKIYLFCPFVELGCITNPMSKDEITIHLQKQIIEHTKLLIEWLLNIRNEIKSSVEIQTKEMIKIELTHIQSSIDLKISKELDLIYNYNLKDQTIMDNLQQEIKILTKQFDELVQKVKIIKAKETEKIKKDNEINDKQNVLLYQMKSDESKDINSINPKRLSKNVILPNSRISLSNLFHFKSTRQAKNSFKIEDNEDKIEIRTQPLSLYNSNLSVVKSSENETHLRIKDVDQSKKDISNQDNKTSISRLSRISVSKLFRNKSIPKHNKIQDKNVQLRNSFDYCPELQRTSTLDLKNSESFMWTIFKINSVLNIGATITSQCFFSTDQKYTIRLFLYPRGYKIDLGTHMAIMFIPYPKESNTEITKPFNGNITVTIKNAIKLKYHLIISRNCLIDVYDYEVFYFSISDLENANVFKNDSISIECMYNII